MNVWKYVGEEYAEKKNQLRFFYCTHTIRKHELNISRHDTMPVTNVNTRYFRYSFAIDLTGFWLI